MEANLNAVKCKDCGFLAVRSAQTRQLLDAEDELREQGGNVHLIIAINQTPPAYDEFPICFVRAANLPAEIRPGHGPIRIKEVLWMDRECKSFTQWHQGFAPKEHQEMLRTEDMIKRDQEWRSKEEWYRRFELLVIIVIAPIMAWLIPFLAKTFIEPLPQNAVNIAAPPQPAK